MTVVHNLVDSSLSRELPIAVQSFYPVRQDVMTTYYSQKNFNKAKRDNDFHFEYAVAIFRLKLKS